jgi:hypothetical protein
MARNSLTSLLLLSGVTTAAAWSHTDHWQATTVVSHFIYRSTTIFDTLSIPVIPTGAATPISSNVSTTLVTAFDGHLGNDYTFEVTVTDLFYAHDATGLCSPFLEVCRPSRTRPAPGIGETITTNYYVPVVISNPVSCTRTSFAYTTAKSLSPLPTVSSILEFDQQATQSAHALAVTTYVSTLGTNLADEYVTTTVCDVYLREGAVGGVGPDTGVHSQCVDPRVQECSVAMARASQTRDFQVFDPSTSAACRTDFNYPPASITAGGVADATPPRGASAGFRIPSKMGWALGVAGVVAVLGFFL